MTPLHLKIKKAALNATIRVLQVTNVSKISWFGSKTKEGHLLSNKKELARLGIHNFDLDKTNELNLWRDFYVDIESFKSGIPNSECDVKCYTDGSRFSGQTGFGFAITRDSKEVKSENGYLGMQATVFQAEITAIQKCAEALASENTFSEAIIYSDSQAALAALLSLKIQHKNPENKPFHTLKL